MERSGAALGGADDKKTGPLGHSVLPGYGVICAVNELTGT